jgi:type II secretory pathway pseudopilin PulG
VSFVLVVILGIVAIAVLTVVVLVVVARRHGPEIVAAQQALFAQTGYADHSPRPTLNSREQHYIRAEPELHFRSRWTRDGQGTVQTLAWWMPRPSPVQVQIADRSLLSLRKAATELVTGSTRSWSQVYPQEVPLGDPELAARFVAFGPDAAAVDRCARALRELLLACPEVDLVATATEIRFSDPRNQNLGDERKAGLNPAPNIRASIPVHRRIQTILEQVAQLPR